MADKQPSANAGTKLPRQAKGGKPIALSRAFINTVAGVCEGILNLKILQPQTDGLATQNPKEADVKISDGAVVITLQPQLNPQGFSGGGGTGAALTWVRYKDDLGDCLECVMWDGTTEGSTVYVAKALELRTTIASEVIAGSTYDYSYSLGSADTNGNHYITRTVTDAVSETDQMTQPYTFNTELWCGTIPSITLNSQACTLIDLNITGRDWGET